MGYRPILYSTTGVTPLPVKPLLKTWPAAYHLLCQHTMLYTTTLKMYMTGGRVAGSLTISIYRGGGGTGSLTFPAAHSDIF